VTGGGGEALLELTGLAGWRGGRPLFEGLNLRLGPGQAALVTGPNGIGKSSLLRIAAGLLPAHAGRVTRADAVLADENLALEPRRTLAAALDFWARLDGVSALRGMEGMGIAHLAQVPVRMLSTGQRKRAALARVIACKAPLWLLDEPANGLDSEGLSRLETAMAQHRVRGGAVLVATHQPIHLPDCAQVKLS
jgi:heme exporter protein A